MREIRDSKYALLFFAGLVFILLCAWFSMGAYHPDEHFQVLEFCSYKLGNPLTNSYGLPWEFFAKIRCSLLPDIAYAVAKILGRCGLYNAFTVAFLLRLLAGIAGWFITCRFCLLFSPELKAVKPELKTGKDVKSPKTNVPKVENLVQWMLPNYESIPKLKTLEGERVFIVMCLFLWFMPFLNVRFTAENISGISFLYGAYFILRIDKKNTGNLTRYFIAGLFFGISFSIRTQMVFAIAGFVAWLIFINKTNWKYIFALAISAIAAIGINILFDCWFYGVWTFTSFNNYYANIIQHAAVYMGGSESWWFYFNEFISNAFSPLSLLLLGMFFVGLYKNLKNPLVWSFMVFFTAHCIIGHKELRFLFPVTFMFIYITALGFDYLLTKKYYQKVHKYLYIASALVCIPLLLYRTLAPAQVAMYYGKYLYNHAPAKNIPLFYIPNRMGDIYNSVNTSFYKNPALNTVLVDDMSQMGDYLRNNKPQSALFFCYTPLQGINENINWNGYRIKLVYCFYPSWAFKYDIDNWKERSHIFCIYQFTPVDLLHGFDVNKMLQDSNSFKNTGTINLILNSAYNALQNDKLDEAENILITVKQKTKGIAIPHLHNYIGMLYAKKNMTEEAKNEFSIEMALNLQKEEAFLNLGLLYFQEKQYNNAINSMDSVIKINPNNSDAYNNAGVYLAYIKKDYTQAMPYFKKAVDINANYGSGYNNIMIYAPLCNDWQAILYQRILVDNRKDPYAW